MRTRSLIAALALGLALVACGGGDAADVSGSSTDLDEELSSLDADTAEVLATSEAILDEDRSGDGVDLPGVDEVPPASSIIASIDEEEAEAEAHAPTGPTARFTLRRGETLAHYARWSGLAVEDIAHASDLDLDGIYPVGTEVVVPVGGSELSALTAARDAHHTARAEAYLASRGGSRGSTFIAVRTGDTAWSIAKDNEDIPVWLLETYNPAVDLERLRPGQELMVPMLSDGTVAEAEPERSEGVSEEAELASEDVAVPIEEEIPDVLPPPVEGEEQ